jgi:histidine triad (HIT) family protein
MMTSYRTTLFVLLAFLLATFNCLAASEEAPVDSNADYDPNNIFAHILQGDLPADVVFENEYAMAFHDIRPKARVHVLVIPKGPYANINRFNEHASDEERLGFLDALSRTAEILGVDASGFRLIANTGPDGGQTVAHMHFHLLGGEYVGNPREAESDQEGAPIE